MGFLLTFISGAMIAAKTETLSDSLYYLFACVIFALGLIKLSKKTSSIDKYKLR
jgi:hypothetical protein